MSFFRVYKIFVYLFVVVNSAKETCIKMDINTSSVVGQCCIFVKPQQHQHYEPSLDSDFTHTHYTPVEDYIHQHLSISGPSVLMDQAIGSRSSSEHIHTLPKLDLQQLPSLDMNDINPLSSEKEKLVKKKSSKTTTVAAATTTTDSSTTAVTAQSIETTTVKDQKDATNVNLTSKIAIDAPQNGCPEGSSRDANGDCKELL